MTVHWTRNALRNPTAIHDHIAQNSAKYALGMVDRITRRSEHAGEFPHLGAVVLEYEDEAIREVAELPYRIIYHVTEDRVEILAVVHGARQLPPNLPG